MSVLFNHTLLNAAATDETAVVESLEVGEKIPDTGFTHTIEWGTGVTAGVVEIEGNNVSATYAGTWANINTVTYAAGAPKSEYVYSPATFQFMRHRISTAVANGTVTTHMSGIING